MDFEDEREANVARNRAILLELAIEKESAFMVRKKAPPKQKQKTQKKRKEAPSNDDDENVKPPRKAAAVVASTDGDASAGPRRSGRNAGKKIDYAGDGDNLRRNNGPQVLTERARVKESEGQKGMMKRVHDPKTFGAIPGVEIGKWWETRMACSADAIHAPWVAGISGGPDGCYSVALSGGYEDDVDLGVAFTYTGSGGRDLKGTKQNPKNLRTAPQSFDQSFEHRDNQALLRSVETQKPVRVIRGYKLKSQYAPREGYRYDGLYTVEKAWQEKGLNPKGLLVCKFAFKRVPGQPPIPIYEDEEDEEAADSATEGTVVGTAEDAAGDAAEPTTDGDTAEPPTDGDAAGLALTADGETAEGTDGDASAGKTLVASEA